MFAGGIIKAAKLKQCWIQRILQTKQRTFLKT